MCGVGKRSTFYFDRSKITIVYSPTIIQLDDGFNSQCLIISTACPVMVIHELNMNCRLQLHLQFACIQNLTLVLSTQIKCYSVISK